MSPLPLRVRLLLRPLTPSRLARELRSDPSPADFKRLVVRTIKSGDPALLDTLLKETKLNGAHRRPVLQTWYHAENGNAYYLSDRPPLPGGPEGLARRLLVIKAHVIFSDFVKFSWDIIENYERKYHAGILATLRSSWPASTFEGLLATMSPITFSTLEHMNIPFHGKSNPWYLAGLSILDCAQLAQKVPKFFQSLSSGFFNQLIYNHRLDPRESLSPPAFDKLMSEESEELLFNLLGPTPHTEESLFFNISINPGTWVRLSPRIKARVLSIAPPQYRSDLFRLVHQSSPTQGMG